MPPEIKLAIVRQHYRPDGGAERFISRALSGLKEADTPIQATVIARSWQIQEGTHYKPCNPSYHGRIKRESSFSQAATQIIKSEDFTLVQSHERMSECDIFRAGDGVHATWLEQKKRISNPLKAWAMYRNGFHRYQLQAEKDLYASTRLKAIICNSKMVLNDIHSRFDVPLSKLHLIYNGLNLQEFNPQVREHNKAQRKYLGLSSEDFVLLFVGSGFERKGLKQCIQALSKAPKNCKLVVLGKDKKQKYYELLAQRLAPKQVIFAGVTDNVLPYLGMADTLLLPSLYDPFPNAINEALACGVPVITSTKTGGAELIIDSPAGFVCDALDVKGLSSAITTLCEDSQIDLRRQAAVDIGKTFELSAATQKLMSLYLSLIERDA